MPADIKTIAMKKNKDKDVMMMTNNVGVDVVGEDDLFVMEKYYGTCINMNMDVGNIHLIIYNYV